MADQTWLLSPEDFEKVEASIRDRKPFSMDLVADGTTVISGGAPSNEGEDQVFNAIRVNSLAHAWLAAAWDFNQLHYVIWVNGIPFGFHTPFGWSFIPRLNYAAGRLPDDFADAHAMAFEVLREVIS